MKDKNKQIEENLAFLTETENRFIASGCPMQDMEKYFAEAMYNEGYRRPSEDVVEVVRCKDCFWYRPLGDQYTYKGKQAMHCFHHSWLVKEDGYCDNGILKPSEPNGKTKIVGKFTAERSGE